MQILLLIKSTPKGATYKFMFDFFYLKRQASYFIYCNNVTSVLQFKSWYQSESIKVEDWIKIVSDFGSKLNPEVLEFYRSKI